MYNNTEMLFLTTKFIKIAFGPLAWNLSVRPCIPYQYTWVQYDIITKVDHSSNLPLIICIVSSALDWYLSYYTNGPYMDMFTTYFSWVNVWDIVHHFILFLDCDIYLMTQMIHTWILTSHFKNQFIILFHWTLFFCTMIYILIQSLDWPPLRRKCNGYHASLYHHLGQWHLSYHIKRLSSLLSGNSMGYYALCHHRGNKAHTNTWSADSMTPLTQRGDYWRVAGLNIGANIDTLTVTLSKRNSVQNRILSLRFFLLIFARSGKFCTSRNGIISLCIR